MMKTVFFPLPGAQLSTMLKQLQSGNTPPEAKIITENMQVSAEQGGTLFGFKEI